MSTKQTAGGRSQCWKGLEPYALIARAYLEHLVEHCLLGNVHAFSLCPAALVIYLLCSSRTKLRDQTGRHRHAEKWSHRMRGKCKKETGRIKLTSTRQKEIEQVRSDICSDLSASLEVESRSGVSSHCPLAVSFHWRAALILLLSLARSATFFKANL